MKLIQNLNYFTKKKLHDDRWLDDA